MVERVVSYRWALVAVALAVVGVAATLSGTWVGRPASPHGDGANYLHWVEHSWQTKTPIWRGHYSYVGLGHPGPIMFHVLLVGRAFASVLPGDQVFAATAVSWMAACYALVAYSCVVVARARQDPYAGVALFFCYLAMVAVSLRRTGSQVAPELVGFEIWPIYAPILATYLTLALLASVLAMALGVRRAAYGVILFSGLSFQSFMELVIPGVILACVAGWTLLGPGRAATRGAWLRTAGAVAVVWLAGFGTFVVRMATEGWDLPLRYIDQILSVVDQGPQDAAASGPVLPDRLDAAWRTGSATWFVAAGLVAVVVLGLARSRTRRLSIVGAAVLLGTAVYLFTSTPTDIHQASPVAAVVPVMLCLPVSAVLRWLASGVGRAGARSRARSLVVAGVSVAIAGAATWGVLHPWYGVKTKPDYAHFAFGTAPGDTAAEIARRYPPGSTVAHWSYDGEPVAAGVPPEALSSFRYESFRRGHHICVFGQGSGPPYPAMRTDCEPADVDAWVYLTVDEERRADDGAHPFEQRYERCWPTECTVHIYPGGPTRGPVG
jgi:hypothetical protein